MSTFDVSRVHWSPQNEVDQALVQEELAAILSSAQFCNSKRYPAFLQYVVTQTLAGQSDFLKERTLGIEVFHRSPDYDTNDDTIVRFTAGEVRKRLSLYYLEHASTSGIQISLPSGSYIPEFFRLQTPVSAVSVPEGHSAIEVLPPQEAPPVVSKWPLLRPFGFSLAWFAGIALTLLIIVGAFYWHQREEARHSLNTFWAPIVKPGKSVLLCPGSLVFFATRAANTAPADKSAEYPFLSVEAADAVALTAGVLQERGATYQVQTSANTTLTDIRERPAILVGAYNNEWTQRLLSPLRFHLSPEPVEGILDASNPNRYWARNHTIPYAESTDYALIARLQDKITAAPLIIIAGLGRNGTEAAAQFATSPTYIDTLSRSIKGDWQNKNIEVILKVPVISSKTGPPSIEAVEVW